MLLVVYEEEVERSRLFAAELDTAPPPLSLGDEVLFAVLYPEPLARLGLLPGPQEVPGPTAPARPLPAGYEAFRSNENRDGWDPISPPDLEAILGKRVLVPPPQCEPDGGCHRRIDGNDGFEYCELPCREPAAPAPPMEPVRPELPRFGPCPTGWSEQSSGFSAMTYCVPPALQTCPSGSTHLLGDAGCEPVGATCSGEFASELPAGRTVWFVRPGSSGDGSLGAPFGTIDEALTAAVDGDVVALSRGTHAGGVTVSRSVDLVGACAETVVEGGASAITVAPGAEVGLKGMALEGTGDGAHVEGRASLDGVIVKARNRGLMVTGALEATELLVVGGEAGGVVVEGTGTATVTRSDLADNRGYGALVEGAGASLVLRDVIARASRSDGTFEGGGFGVAARSGARLVVERILLEENVANGLAVWSGATVQAKAVVGRRNAEYDVDLDRAFGQLERVVSLQPALGGLWFFREVQATVLDAYVFGSLIRAVTTNDASTVTFERVLLEGNVGRGFTVSEGGSAIARDLTVVDQAEDANRDGGFGVHVLDGRLEATRTLVEKSTGYGVLVQGRDSEAVMLAEDLTVREIATTQRGAPGLICTGIPVGVRVDGQTRFEGRRVLVEGEHLGVAFRSFDDHRIEDLTIRGATDIGFCASDGFYEVERALIEGTAGRGIDLDGAFLQANDLVVRDTSDTPDVLSGIGVRVDGTQSLDAVRLGQANLDRFRLTDNVSAGLRLDLSANMELKNGEISGSEIGIQVDQPAFDPTGRITEVIYRNNRTNVVF